MNASMPVAAAFELRAVADCPFSVAQDYATEFFCNQADALIRCRLGRWRVIVPGSSPVAARPDLTERGTPHDELVLQWRPALPVLPRLEIVVRFRIAWLTTSIAMQIRSSGGGGIVRRPLSAVFGVFARCALGNLLWRLTSYLEQRERAYRRANPPALGPVRKPPLDAPSTADRPRADAQRQSRPLVAAFS